MRPCVCCNLEEIRPQLDQYIRDGKSCAALAREFSEWKISPDAIERHARNHVLKVEGDDLDAATVFHEIATRAGEIARSATLTGDLRGAIDALGRQAAAAEPYTRIAEAKQEKASEAELVWTADGQSESERFAILDDHRGF